MTYANAAVLKSTVFKWSVHICGSERSKTELKNVRFSDGFRIRIFGIRAPTVPTKMILMINFLYVLYIDLQVQWGSEYQASLVFK